MLKFAQVLLFISLISVGISQAQSFSSTSSGNKWVFGPTVSYQYQSRNFAKVSLWGLTDLNYADYLKVDAAANFTWQGGETHVIPELGLTYYLNTVAVWPFVKAEVTPYTVTPKVGVGLFNLMELGVGYGWSLQEKNNLGKIKGFNFSVGFSLPLSYSLR